MQYYTKEQALAASLEYFNQDALAAGVFVDKYALRTNDGLFLEKTPEDMHWRLAKEFARIESKYPNPLSAEEIFTYLDRFNAIVPQGSPMAAIGNREQAVSASNCAVLASPQDTISSIMETARDMANLYKRRFGVGIDISELRPDGAPVNNSARTSTGAWSFADFYSYVTRMIGQGSRRGALMLTIDVRHPDVEKFITMKADLQKVTGANVSVRASDDFMRAVETDAEFTLRWPVDHASAMEKAGGDTRPLAKFERTVRAKQVFQLIADQAAKTAEPGLLFWDTATRNLPLHQYPGFTTISTNPCSEITLSANDSCRLISIYLANFVRNEFAANAYFDLDAFEETVRVAMRLSDDLVDLELEILERLQRSADTDDEKTLYRKFYEACANGRRTGLGTHGLGDTLARLGMTYGSHESKVFIKQLYTKLKTEAYDTSVTLAQERGPFPVWDDELDNKSDFVHRLPAWVWSRMQKYGRRNGAILTNAPTGSVSILSDNCSSGIEPVFMNSYYRKRKVNHNEVGVRVDYTDGLGDKWTEYKVYHPNVERFLRLAYADPLKYLGYELEEHLTFEQFKETATLPAYFVTSADIPYMDRVELQGLITEQLDHAVSSTVNLPKGTTGATIADLYLQAWKAQCKGITVYVDGSRDAQVLSSESVKETPATVPTTTTTTLRTRELATHGPMVKAEFRDTVGNARKVYTYVGYNTQQEPVEVFVTDAAGDPDYMPYAAALGKLVSLALKFNVPVDDIAKAMIGLQGGSTSFSGKVYTSVPDLVGKLLLAAPPTATTTPKPAASTVTATVTGFVGSQCPSCKAMKVKNDGGCVQCVDCGWTKC